MDILFAMNGANTRDWLDGLHSALPEARIRTWERGDNAAADYVLYWKADAAALSRRDGLKAIFNMGAGVDALLRIVHENPDAVATDIPIVRLEDAGMAQQMVEYAVYCALRFARRFDEYESLSRQRIWKPLDAYSIDDFPIGVLGAGKLGLPVAQALANLGFPVRVYSRSAKAVEGMIAYAGQERLEAFASGARMLVNLLPNTPETEGILNRRLFDAMADDGYVVNLARGSHIDDADLIAALDSGKLARAVLDVFRNEPLAEAHPFWLHDRIDVTPHISARTLIPESVAQVADKIRRSEQGEKLFGLDLQRGY
ncbi:2-hydroxyacid dehydrogenase [Paraburkholderia lycopersici]|uniref:Glyoxylate/hydroxypyruvate reductase A n=1 Tax=Paraburkholderia lycopersici TaxID=416944 RepID=A0A1G6LW79_9BURK|nr:glyoxylate/hydroxypyruvate reductase A [Paraburkholderia lycopersici]SDC47558.1 glyoxylate/hydroxypyruvate reductase A [Paraburkholderia lycopersici]